MIEHSKIATGHLARQAVVSLRQSSASQVENNRESTDRKYALSGRARELGWPAERIVVIDEDLGLSGSGSVMRSGFARLTSEVALARVGIVLGLEVSRLARNNADWHRLIELAGLTDTLIGDADGIYHPALFNDRLLLGLKGAMSEAELHVLRARLDGGIRNKAARGELRRGLPVGFIWGEDDGEILIHPDEAVSHVIRTIFARFAELGSARRVWLWLRANDIKFPLRLGEHQDLRWSEASYHGVHAVLANPVYAGAYVYGKNRHETVLDETGARRKRVRKLPRDEWQVLIKDHHQGYIDWPSFEVNQQRMATNTQPRPHSDASRHSAGAVREGGALLQGIAHCGHCGRRLRTHYRGRNAAPGYHCAGKIIVDGRGVYCLNIGGVQIDEAVAAAFLEALEPARLTATIEAAERLESDREATLKQSRLDVERAQFAVNRAKRRYRAVDPDNRLVARSLEREWEEALRALEVAKTELARREEARPRLLSSQERANLLTLGVDLVSVWHAPSTTARDHKELLRTLIEEVTLHVDRDNACARLTLRWKGGAIGQLEVALPRSRPATVRTDEDTLTLVRRLAPHYPDAVIAGVLNRQGRQTARGHRFDANRVGNLRRHWNIPACKARPQTADGDILTIRQAASVLGVAPSTLHRHLNDGLIRGEQITPGAPWRIRLTDELKARFLTTPDDGFEPIRDALDTLGLSRQALLQRVRHGELESVYVIRGQRKGLWIKTIDQNPTLFEHML
ncbi:recombinase family protein [Rhizobium jaguaris]|uniref:Recombinase family protein n=1 Tax=Rhizobium jaguaris TaxID=1312183 RepID=A0A387G7F1_9HYPH|nr:recombinase family protein [Rhizobium jaguaris]AYG64094.1 recombinase family protein [Rhizobium jaguaris]